MEYVIIGIMAAIIAFGVIGHNATKKQRAEYLATLGGATPSSPGEPRCGKCQGPMVLGFVPDKEEFGYRPGSWLEGSPKGSELTVQVRLDRCVPIGAFRCSQCGYLEFYARPEFMPK
jgi:hypothetical protein